MKWLVELPDRARKLGSETCSTAGATTRLSFSPSLKNPCYLGKLLPLSQTLSALGAAGLAALDYLDRGEVAQPAWVTAQLALVEQAKKAQAQLLVMVAPSVGKLVHASAGRHRAAAPPTLPAK